MIKGTGLWRDWVGASNLFFSRWIPWYLASVSRDSEPSGASSIPSRKIEPASCFGFIFLVPFGWEIKIRIFYLKSLRCLNYSVTTVQSTKGAGPSFYGFLVFSGYFPLRFVTVSGRPCASERNFKSLCCPHPSAKSNFWRKLVVSWHFGRECATYSAAMSSARTATSGVCSWPSSSGRSFSSSSAALPVSKDGTISTHRTSCRSPSPSASPSQQWPR